MKKRTACILGLLILLSATNAMAQMSSEPFEFQFENKTLRGLIEKPENKASKAIVIIIPGYGKTNFVKGKWFSRLRQHLVDTGLTVVLWDKMGCGDSEGVFDAQQPVENSADEAIAAIDEIKRLQVPGLEKIGFWGISRAGWIVPLINAKYPMDFWISVSGTDDKENFGYLLKSNLLIAGMDEKETKRLYDAWMLGHKIYNTKGSYQDYLKATEPLRQDSTCQKLFGYKEIGEITQKDIEDFKTGQEQYTGKGHFDEASGLWVYIDDFDKTLLKINCPVLGLFGANDSQVDWRKTKKLYEETIGVNPKAELQIQVFENCNHVLQQCVTCAWREDLSSFNWAPCNSYYETMQVWLQEQGIVD